MAQSGNCHSFTSKSVMTFAGNGQPQVYQATMSTRTAPGGVKETKTTVCDSRTGTKKMAIEHHIGDRAHILEREHNLHSGEQEERQEFINLDEGFLHKFCIYIFIFFMHKVKIYKFCFLQKKQRVLIMSGNHVSVVTMVAILIIVAMVIKIDLIIGSWLYLMHQEG